MSCEWIGADNKIVKQFTITLLLANLNYVLNSESPRGDAKYPWWNAGFVRVVDIAATDDVDERVQKVLTVLVTRYINKCTGELF